MTITGEKPQSSSGQKDIDHTFSTRGQHLNHLGAFYKIQMDRSGPGPSRSQEGISVR